MQRLDHETVHTGRNFNALISPAYLYPYLRTHKCTPD